MPADVIPCTDCPDDFAAVTADNEAETDAKTDPRGDKVTRWRGLLAPIGKPTGDGRRFAAKSLTHRDLPLPLKWQREGQTGHTGAVTVGTLDGVEYSDDGVQGTGVLFTPDPEQLPRLAEDVAEARMLLDQKVIGPSVDLDAMEFKALPGPEGEEFAEGGKPKEIEVTAGRISAATLVQIPAFAEARPFELYQVDAAEYAAEQEAMLEAVTASVTGGAWDQMPIAPAGTPWDPAAAAGRIADWAAGDANRYGSCFLWSAPFSAGPGEPDEDDGSMPTFNAAAYKFPIADIIDGYPQIVPNAVLTAQKVLAGDKGGTTLPYADQRSLAATLAAIQFTFDPDLDGDDDRSPQTDTDNDADSGPDQMAADVDAFAAELPEPASLFEAIPDLVEFGARFDKLKAKLAAQGVDDPEGLAAKIGRKKYGAKGFKKLVAGVSAAKVKPMARTASADLQEAMVAAAAPHEAPELPPAALFEMPEADRRTPLTVTPDGRVFGHIADWRTCHTGFAGQCVRAPKSRTGYAYFHTGAVTTADQGDVRVGRISVGGGHASTAPGMGFQAAVAHYDNASTVAAEGRASNGKHGIWFSGRVVPEARGTTLEDQLRRHPPSGDWRKVGGDMELVHILAVNSPGFPVVSMTASAAGMELEAIVAAGVVVADGAMPPAVVDVAAIARQAAREALGERDRAERRATAATLLSRMDDSLIASAADARRAEALRLSMTITTPRRA